MTLNAEYVRMDEEELRDLAPLWGQFAAAGRPYTVHVAKLVSDNGEVSPICEGVDKPRALGPRESWVYSPNNYQYVTCASCMAALKEGEVDHGTVRR